MLNFDPTVRDMARLVHDVPDDALDGPTPCPDMSVAALLDHIAGLSLAFTVAARKEAVDGGTAPSPDAAQLDPDWRSRIPEALDELAAAWTEPDAWTGMTAAGGVELPGDVAALVALDELVVHGWDLAVATGQPYDPDPDLLEVVHEFVRGFSGPGQEEAREGLFGPEVPVPEDAPLLDRVIGLTGRDPGWTRA